MSAFRVQNPGGRRAQLLQLLAKRMLTSAALRVPTATGPLGIQPEFGGSMQPSSLLASPSWA